MSTLLAQNVITPKAAVCIGPICPDLMAQQGALATRVLSTGLRLVIIIIGMFALAYLLWGALDYVTSEGEKDRIAKAQKKMQFALIGVLLAVVALSLYTFIAGDILGIITRDPVSGNWRFQLPTLF